MLGKRQKQDVETKLNDLFAGEEELREFCHKMSNDIDKVYEGISKIIKYVIVKHNTFLYKNSIEDISKHLIEADELYREYLASRKKRLFSFFSNKRGKTKIDILVPIDADIELTDIEGVILPSREKLEQLCNENLERNQRMEEERKKRETFFREQIGFEETGLIYKRPEELFVDSDLLYYYTGTSGNIEQDFRTLYNGERYQGRLASISPLHNSYEENIAQIRKQNDISLTKLGNVYFIENGRHRILYIMRNGMGAIIPISISRRIEDQEFNRILEKLRQEYNMVAYKNNILNDAPDILLKDASEAYRIKSKEELLIFYDNLQAGRNNHQFEKIPFENEPEVDKVEFTRKYKALIYQKYAEYGKEIITGNFSEVIKYFDEINVLLLYEAFTDVQYEYQRDILLGEDFGKKYRIEEIELESVKKCETR